LFINQLTDLGDVKAVGEKLASSRNMILEDSRERITEGIRFYDFVFKGERMMEVRSLSVYKGKLWGVTATSSERYFLLATGICWAPSISLSLSVLAGTGARERLLSRQ
jgi:hypothetical protein